MYYLVNTMSAIDGEIAKVYLFYSFESGCMFFLRELLREIMDEEEFITHEPDVIDSEYGTSYTEPRIPEKALTTNCGLLEEEVVYISTKLKELGFEITDLRKKKDFEIDA